MKLIHKFLISFILNLVINTPVFSQKTPELTFSVLIKVFDSTRTSKEILLLNKETITVGQNIKQNNSIIYVEFSTKYLNYKNSTIIYKISKKQGQKIEPISNGEFDTKLGTKYRLLTADNKYNNLIDITFKSEKSKI